MIVGPSIPTGIENRTNSVFEKLLFEWIERKSANEMVSSGGMMWRLRLLNEHLNIAVKPVNCINQG